MFDRVIVMKDGSISEQGMYSELMKREDGVLRSLMKEEKVFEEEVLTSQSSNIPDTVNSTHRANEDQLRAEPSNVALALATKAKAELNRGYSEPAFKRETGILSTEPSNKKLTGKGMSDYGIPTITPKASEDEKKRKGRLGIEEKRETGAVKKRIYMVYGLAGTNQSYALLIVLLFLFVCAESAFLSIDAYLGLFSQQDKSGSNLTPEEIQAQTDIFIGIYVGLTCLFVLFILIRSISFALFSVQASETLHKLMVRHTLRFPMSFFWVTPMGRVINRLSADTNAVDTILPGALQWLLMCLARVIGILIVIVVATPIFAATIVPLLLMYVVIYEFYRRTSRETQRLESLSRSPLFNHLSETGKGQILHSGLWQERRVDTDS